MNKKRLVLLIALLIIAVIGGVSIYTNYSKKYSTSVDQQANLKTYANRKARFSVQYSIEYQDSVGDDFLKLDDKTI